jgi:hypothetical protein
MELIAVFHDLHDFLEWSLFNLVELRKNTAMLVPVQPRQRVAMGATLGLHSAIRHSFSQRLLWDGGVATSKAVPNLLFNASKRDVGDVATAVFSSWYHFHI